VVQLLLATGKWIDTTVSATFNGRTAREMASTPKQRWETRDLYDRRTTYSSLCRFLGGVRERRRGGEAQAATAAQHSALLHRLFFRPAHLPLRQFCGSEGAHPLQHKALFQDLRPAASRPSDGPVQPNVCLGPEHCALPGFRALLPVSGQAHYLELLTSGQRGDNDHYYVSLMIIILSWLSESHVFNGRRRREKQQHWWCRFLSKRCGRRHTTRGIPAPR